MLNDLDTLTSTSYVQLRQQLSKTRSVHAFARVLPQVICLAFEQSRVNLTERASGGLVCCV
ncbi:hypothetical protein P3102_10625 [Amycolatopsis sp. QT-25]|uniref:hypothetical protein n=1 Tax=Amycolatopsis sp. QT-25 TaxID=3034022 RepID=UPI0023EC537E|nr:hypothetical protein [Amycolatopsis sp. QT-25]WET81627.1 hypothetical protein P3102_10625 [Amycolatopsis sp. QT-25]